MRIDLHLIMHDSGYYDMHLIMHDSGYYDMHGGRKGLHLSSTTTDIMTCMAGIVA